MVILAVRVIMTLWDDAKAWMTRTEAEARDLRRRHAQAVREGFRHSGRPHPVPVYRGPPAPGGELSGIETNTVTGTGAQVAVSLNTGGPGRTWVYTSMNKIVAGGTAHMQEDYVIAALTSGNRALGIVGLFEGGRGHSTGGFHTASYARIPAEKLTAFISLSMLAHVYEFTGVWEEDR